MIITQPDRILIKREISSFGSFMTGNLLDVGGGSGKRYKFNTRSHRSLDIKPTADIVASADAIPLKSNSIDSIICSQMLEHVKNPAKCLSEMFRVLKPGGYAILTAPQMNELHEEPNDYYRYTIFGLCGLCKESGFSIIKQHQRGKYHTLMAQNRIRRWIDLLKPYERKWAMLLMVIPSKLYTNIALMLDQLDHSQSSKKHALGWTLLLRKDLRSLSMVNSGSNSMTDFP